MSKEYVYETVSYGSQGKKWAFNTTKYCFLTAVKGGAKTAHKIARVVSGSFKRTGAGLDNLGRANIAQIFAKVGK